METARAEAERIKLQGEAEAFAVQAVGQSEANKLRMKAQAYKQYGDAAVMAMVLESLPQIAAEVSAPLAKTDEIVMIGSDNCITNGITKLVSELPPAVQALTGVDVSKVCNPSQEILFEILFQAKFCLKFGFKRNFV